MEKISQQQKSKLFKIEQATANSVYCPELQLKERGRNTK